MQGYLFILILGILVASIWLGYRIFNVIFILRFRINSKFKSLPENSLKEIKGLKFFRVEAEDSEIIECAFLKGRLSKLVIFSNAEFESIYTAFDELDFFIDKGWNIIVYNSRAHFNSGGKFYTYGLKESDDLSRIILWARENVSFRYLSLYGVSFGAVTSVLSLVHNVDVDSIIVRDFITSFEDWFFGILESKKIPVRFHNDIFDSFQRYVERYLKLNVVDICPIYASMKASVPIYVLSDISSKMDERFVEFRSRKYKTEIVSSLDDISFIKHRS